VLRFPSDGKSGCLRVLLDADAVAMTLDKTTVATSRIDQPIIFAANSPSSQRSDHWVWSIVSASVLLKLRRQVRQSPFHSNQSGNHPMAAQIHSWRNSIEPPEIAQALEQRQAAQINAVLMK
jgi:hypothetical protein